MSSDPNHDSDELGSLGTSLLQEPKLQRIEKSHPLFMESVTHGGIQVDVAVEFHLGYSYPETWTVAESRSALEDVFARSPIKSQAVYRCLTVFGSLPEAIVPSVVDQFEEIAEYEARMWFIRQEALAKPRTEESKVTLQLASGQEI